MSAVDLTPDRIADLVEDLAYMANRGFIYKQDEKNTILAAAATVAALRELKNHWKVKREG